MRIPGRQELRRFAEAMCLEAGALLINWFGRELKVDYKGVIDPVTEADRASEDLLIERIRGEYDDHRILTEESPPIEGAGGVRWIVDPLDGTTNFAHGVPIFTVSIAAEVDGETVAGAVYTPVLNELYSAHLGGGATLNETPIRVSTNDTLNRSLLATGFPYDIASSPDNNLDHFHNLRPLCQGIRRCGVASWDLCNVARGCFDGFWEAKLKPWDVAAGALIVAESGGVITGFHGQPFSAYARQVVASNGRIHESVLAALARGKTMMSAG